MERLSAFLTDPANRTLMMELFLEYGRAYRSRSACIPPDRIPERAVSEMRSCSLVEKHAGGLRLTGTGKAVGYGVLELHEFRQRKGNPRHGGPDVPAPDAGLVKDKVFLDVGCGGGSYVDAAADSGALMAIGVDLQLPLLRLGRTLCNGREALFIQAKCESLPLESLSAHVVLLRGVLPYVENGRTLKELARVSARGGRLFLTTLGPGYFLRAARDALQRKHWPQLAYAALVSLNGLLQTFTGYRLPYYLKKFSASELLSAFNTPKSLCRTLKRNGFTVTQIRRSPARGIPRNIYVEAVRA